MAKPVQAREGREPYWRQVVDRWKQSGLAVPAFCRREGLNQGTFYHWRWELKRRDRSKTAFLPVHVIADKPAPPTGSGIEVVLANGRSLRIGVGFDSHTLVQVVALLEEGGHSC
jgi:hypothetical protein